MTYIESIILGIVQGLGEFLPISSSAHLVIAKWLFGYKESGLAYDVALHLGTLLAVLLFFWKDFFKIGMGTISAVTKGRSQTNDSTHLKTFICLVVATIPAAVVGFLFDDLIEAHLRSPWIVGLSMLVFGSVLFWVDRKKGQLSIANMSYLYAFLIGVAQCFALIPGGSRSGVTISMALFLGFSRSESARFSFLMSAPIVLGATLLKIKYIGFVLTEPVLLTGVVVSALVGFLSIQFLMKLVRTRSFAPFCYYRFLFAAFVLVNYLF